MPKSSVFPGRITSLCASLVSLLLPLGAGLPAGAVPPRAAPPAQVAPGDDTIFSTLIDAEMPLLKSKTVPAAGPPAWYGTFETAIRYAQTGRREEAYALFQKVLKDQPRMAAVWGNLAILDGQRGQNALALADLTKAVSYSADPHEAVPFWTQIILLRARANQWPECIAAARKNRALTPAGSPPNTLATTYLGLALLHEKRFDEALAILRKRPLLHGDPPQAADLRIVYALEQAGRIDEALAAALAAGKRFPHDPRVAQAVGVVGDAAVRQDRYDVALSAYQAAYALQPTVERQGFNSVAAAIRLGRVSLGMEMLRKLVARFPDDARAHFELGLLYFSEPSENPDHLVRAEKELRIAAIHDPLKPEYITQLGLAIVLQLNRPTRLDDAEHLFDGALKLDPTNGMARVGRGFVDEERAAGDKANSINHLDDAAAQYRAEIALNRTDETDAKARRRLAGVLYLLGAKDMAYKEFDALVKRYPTTFAAPTLTDEASLLVSDKRYAEASAAYSRLIILRPRDVSAYIGLGRTREFLKDPAGAQRQYEQALVVQPDNATAALSLGNLLKAQGKPAEAIAVYERALAGNPRGGVNQIRLQLGSDYAAAGRVDDALRAFRSLTLRKEDPNRSTFLLTAPKYLIAQKRYADAERDLDEIVAENPSDEEAKYALASARELNGHADAAERTLLALAGRPAGQADPASATRASSELSAFYERGKRYDDAAKVYEDMIRAHPESTNALNGLSRVRMDQKRNEAAGAFLENIALAGGDEPNAAIVNDIAQLYLGMDRTPERYGAFLGRLAEKYPKDRPTQIRVISYLLDVDGLAKPANRAAADPLLKRLLARDPKDFDALYRLGTVYEKEGRKADAVAEYTAAVRADYGNGPAVAALTRLGAPVPAAPAPLAVPPAPMPKAPALPVPNGAASPSGSQPPASKTRPAPVAPAK